MDMKIPSYLKKDLKKDLKKVSMKSQFPFRSEFQESLNIYPRKIFSLKLEGFLGLLVALGIFGVMGNGIKRD